MSLDIVLGKYVDAYRQSISKKGSSLIDGLMTYLVTDFVDEVLIYSVDLSLNAPRSELRKEIISFYSNFEKVKAVIIFMKDDVATEGVACALEEWFKQCNFHPLNRTALRKSNPTFVAKAIAKDIGRLSMCIENTLLVILGPFRRDYGSSDYVPQHIVPSEMETIVVVLIDADEAPAICITLLPEEILDMHPLVACNSYLGRVPTGGNKRAKRARDTPKKARVSKTRNNRAANRNTLTKYMHYFLTLNIDLVQTVSCISHEHVSSTKTISVAKEIIFNPVVLKPAKNHAWRDYANMFRLIRRRHAEEIDLSKHSSL